MMHDEELVLSAMLLGEIQPDVLGVSAFRSEWHQSIWLAAIAAQVGDGAADVITVSARMTHPEIHSLLLDLVERHDPDGDEVEDCVAFLRAREAQQ